MTNHVLTMVAGNEGGTGKTTLSDLLFARFRLDGVAAGVVEIDNAPRLSKRVSKEKGGADLVKAFHTLAPAPDHNDIRENEKAAVRHYNPLWSLIKGGNVLLDQGGSVFKGVAQWWVANGVRERCEKGGIAVQIVGVCIPEAETVRSALATAKIAAEAMLPKGGDSKLFVLFNEKDQPGGFKALEGYKEYRELRGMCEKGVATAIDIPSCRSDFYKAARTADISIAALLERLGERAALAAMCREVGLDVDDELTIDQERDSLDDWLATVNAEIGKLVHPALLKQDVAAE